MEYVYKTPEIKDIQEIRSSVGWDPRSTEKWEEIISKTQLFYCAYDGDTLVSVCRVVEDGAMCMIYDFVVRKEYQNQGIGSTMMETLLDKLQPESYVCFGLFPTEEAIPLYERFGFKVTNGMEYIKKS